MENNIKCPYCAEEIKSEAKICKHCKKEILTKEAKENIEKETFKKERKKRIWILWIITLFVPYLLPISIWLHPAKDEKKLFINRLKNFKKYPIRVIFLLLSIFSLYWIISSGLEEDRLEKIRIEKQEKENKIQIKASYDIKNNFTDKDKIKVKLVLNDIKSLTINNDNINIKNNQVEKDISLKIWDNSIIIIWKNWDVTRKIIKNIKRLNAKEYKQKLKEIEEEKIRQEEIAKIKKEKEEYIKIKKEIEETQFSAWDWSHRKLKKFVTDNLKDPDSFEHIETTYNISKNKEWKYEVFVIMKYRAKNSFGWYVIWFQKGFFDKEGNPIRLSEWVSS